MMAQDFFLELQIDIDHSNFMFFKYFYYFFSINTSYQENFLAS